MVLMIFSPAEVFYHSLKCEANISRCCVCFKWFVVHAITSLSANDFFQKRDLNRARPLCNPFKSKIRPRRSQSRWWGSRHGAID